MAAPTEAAIKVTDQALQAAVSEVAIVKEVSSRLVVPLSALLDLRPQVSIPTASLHVSLHARRVGEDVVSGIDRVDHGYVLR